MEIVQYILIVNICLSICYLLYRLISKDETNFRQLRFFLLVSIIISLLLPLNSFKINIGSFLDKNIISSSTYTQSKQLNDDFKTVYSINQSNPVKNEITHFKKTDWILLSKIVYLSITIMLVFRVIIQITQLV
jgi:hypothetical protein